MRKDDPFGFDIRASADKKKRARGRRGMSGAVETSQRQCDAEGCEEHGQYRAPKSPDTLDDYFWFCKKHVREYNLKWNFFHGATEEQRAWARLGVDDPHQVLGENATRNPGRSDGNQRRLPPTERRAIEILDARDSWTKVEIRQKYKSLVKDLHPDTNGGDRGDEERFHEVRWAWDQIKDSRNFRD
jgi:hypothetical protein